MIKKRIATLLGLCSLIFVCNNAIANDTKNYTENDWIKAKNICDNHVTSIITQYGSATTTTSISLQFNAGDEVGEQCMMVYSHFIYESQTEKTNQINFLNDITKQKGKN